MPRAQVSSSEKVQSSDRASSLDNTCLTSGYFSTCTLSGYVNRLYKELTEINPYNAKIIRNYIEAEKVEINIKESPKANSSLSLLDILLTYFETSLNDKCTSLAIFR